MRCGGSVATMRCCKRSTDRCMIAAWRASGLEPGPQAAAGSLHLYLSPKSNPPPTVFVVWVDDVESASTTPAAGIVNSTIIGWIVWES